MITNKKTEEERDNPVKGWSSPSPRLTHDSHSIVANMVQDRVPYVCADVGPHVFIEAFSWAAAMVTNFEGFADFYIISEASFLFSLHFSYYFEVFFVELLCAVLVVLCDA